jgi:hypothetical protein
MQEIEFGTIHVRSLGLVVSSSLVLRCFLVPRSGCRHFFDADGTERRYEGRKVSFGKILAVSSGRMKMVSFQDTRPP